MRSRRCAALLLLLWACMAGCGAAPVTGTAARLVVSRFGDAGHAEEHRQPVAKAAGDKPSVGMSMSMTFFSGNMFNLWFKGFDIHNAGTLTAACLGVAIMAALYEGLKVFRIILADRIGSSTVSSKGHWLQVILHVVQVTCSYFLMLATMTYSSWIMVSVCAGAGLGYAVFALMVPKNRLFGMAAEHCH